MILKEKKLESMLETEENKYIRVKIHTILSKLKHKKKKHYSLLEKIIKEAMESEE